MVNRKVVMVVSALVLAIVFLFGIYACAKPAPAPSPTPAPKPAPSPTPQWPKSLVITTPPAGGVIAVYATALSKIIEGNLKIPTSPQTCSSALEAAMVSIKGDSQIGGYSGAELIYALLEREPFPKGSAGIVRGMFFGEYKSDSNFFVRVDSGINSISDLKGKRVMCSRPGQAAFEEVWRAVLEAYGMTEKDIIVMPVLGIAEGAQALKEKKADCVYQQLGTPGPAYLELSQSVPIKVLSLSDAAIKNTCEKTPWSMPNIVKAGAYKGHDSDAKIVTALAGIMPRKDLPDDLVYSIAKAIDENMDVLRPVHPSFKNWTIKGLANTPYGPYHAGALKYFMEKGYLTADSIATHKSWLEKIGQKS